MPSRNPIPALVLTLVAGVAATPATAAPCTGKPEVRFSIGPGTRRWA